MKILIVGHGEYSTGIKSSIKLLTGIDENIDAINLNDELTHDEFTLKVQKSVRLKLNQVNKWKLKVQKQY